MPTLELMRSRLQETARGLPRRLRFATRLVAARATRRSAKCPYCGGRRWNIVATKFILLEVRRCLACGLMYRFPQERPDRARSYYQEEYDSFERGLVTQLPSGEALEKLVATNFRGSQWDASDRIDMISDELVNGRLLDYGCSWGYFLVQANARGFDVVGFEISASRAEFATRQLGLRVLTDSSQLHRLPPMSFDVIYASHVLEHLDSPRPSFETFARLLRPGGILLVFVPNCGGESARRLRLHWGPFSNEAHLLSFDADFFQMNLPGHGFTVTCRSEPYSGSPQLAGDELMVLARRDDPGPRSVLPPLTGGDSG